MSKARAIVARAPLPKGGWGIETLKLREMGERKLVVRIVASGVCHTDVLLESQKEDMGGIYPSVKGHEGAGYVERVGSKVSITSVSDPVLLSFAFCKKCTPCECGHLSNCTNFQALNLAGNLCFSSAASDIHNVHGGFFGQSSFASRTIVNEASVINVKGIVQPDELKLFAPLGCGILTGCGTVVNVAQAGPQDVVAVIGLGGVGLSAIMGAKTRGCKTIIGIDQIESRCDIAKELGATHTINTTDLEDLSDIVSAVRALTGGHGTTIALDTTGFVPLIQNALAFTGTKGKIIQVGNTSAEAAVKVSLSELILGGKQYMGSMMGGAPPSDFLPQMISWYRSGLFPVDKMVKFYPADDWKKALNDMHTGHAVKAVLTW